MARQLVRTDIDYGAVGQAGMVPNYEGEALAAIGTIIGEAISNVEPRSKKIKKQENEISEVPVVDLTPKITATDIKPPEFSIPEKKVDEALEKPIDSGGRLDYYSPVFEKFTKKEKSAWEKRGAKSGRSGVDDYIYYMENELPEANKQARETVRQFSASKPKGFVYDPTNPAHVNEFKASKYFSETLPYNFLNNPVKRLKDSPLERRGTVNPRGRTLANMSNEQQFNYRAMTGTQSQLPTKDDGKTFVAKERYLRTPSWASGTSVAAAIEGWNIGAEARNYRNQVKADYKDFQNRQWDRMQEQAKADSLLPKSQLASMKYLQEQFVKSENLPSVEKNEIRARIADQLTDIERSGKLIQDTQAWIEENGSSINIDMMTPEQLDMYNTLRDGGGMTALLPNENGKMAFMGLTKAKMPFNTDLNSFSDIKNGFLATLPRKVDIYSQMNAIADGIKEDDYSRTTIDADGVIRKTAIPLEDLKVEIDYDLEAVINQQGLKNIAGSLPIYQGEKGRDAFTLSMRKFEVDDPRHPYNVVKEHLAEGIHHKLSGHLGQIEEKESAGLKSQYKMQEAILDQQLRERQAAFKTEKDIEKALTIADNKIDNVTKSKKEAESIANQQVADFFKDKSAWIRTNAGSDFEMQGTELVLGPESDDEQRYDLNRKEDVIALIRDYSSKAGGKAGVEFDMFVKNAIEARRKKKLP